MPQNPPPTTQPFISQASGLTWLAGHYVASDETAYYVHTFEGGAWNLTTIAGRYTIAQEAALLLESATANADGSFMAVSGADYWLELSGTVAVAVTR